MTEKDNNLYISQFALGQVLVVDLNQPTPVVSTLLTGFTEPVGLAISGNFLYIGDKFSVNRVDLNDPDLTIMPFITSGLLDTRGVALNGSTMYMAQNGEGGKVFRFFISNPTFSTQPNVCINTSPNNLGGASPIGGVYAGPGVTDNGDGTTYTFDPVAAGGIGSYDITYTLNDVTANAEITVVEAPTVAFDLGGLSYDINDGTQTGLGGGTPTGGVYSGMGVTDDGNGMTFTFDPMAAGAGEIEVTYTFTDDNGCGGPVMNMISVTVAVANNACDGAVDLNDLFGQPVGEAQTSALFNNNDATSDPSDPTTGLECFGEPNSGGGPLLNRTLWFTFIGDGNTYNITTVECNATDYIDFGDTQIAIYSGECNDVTPVICAEDEDLNNSMLNALVADFTTEVGVTYRMLVDGFGANFPTDGEFCIEVTRNTDVAITDLQDLGTSLYPNPTKGILYFQGETPVRVELMDLTGRKVLVSETATNRLDISELPAGMYTLVAQLRDGQLGVSKVMKN
ncbi:hypothetical protein CEQ90_13690 [Lewinellaceae bacterium SD302]|nr:hypothetical protein CEQ90_13690 [Lewinellaceae bacterium SD302]